MRRAALSSAHSPTAATGGRRARTRLSCWTTRRGSATRSVRRPTRWPGRPPRSPTSASPRRLPTCSTTCRCCCCRGAYRSATCWRRSMAVAAERAPEVRPSLAEARELAHSGNAIPVRMTFVDDCETPVSAFLKLRDGGPCFLLESAEQGRLGRYSFLGFRPRAMLRYADGELAEWRGGATPDAEPVSVRAVDDPYGAVSEYLEAFRLPPVDDLPP